MNKKWMAYLFFFCCTSLAAQDLGKVTYQAACRNCHAPNYAKAIKSPPAFDKKAWKARFQHAKEEVQKHPDLYKTPMDYLLYNVTIGKGLMHHGGLCHETGLSDKYCSKEAYIEAIEYMSKQ